MGTGRAEAPTLRRRRGGAVHKHTLAKPAPPPAPKTPKTSKKLKREAPKTKTKTTKTENKAKPENKAKTENKTKTDTKTKTKTTTPASPPVKGPATEKRLRKFRDHAPQSFGDVYNRALTQRFFVLSRTRGGDPLCPEETVEITGTTGNIYTIHIARQPSCDCPHATNGHQCKHWLYVMSRVLKARYEYVYQLALLSTELQEIFAKAPPILDPTSSTNDKNRKPVEDDCPICFSEFDKESDQIVWCRAVCGQNLHKLCFDMWSASKGQGNTTCPFCRSPWESDPTDVSAVVRSDRVNSEGYVSVAGQLGITGERDYSSYSDWFWRHRGMRPPNY